MSSNDAQQLLVFFWSLVLPLAVVGTAAATASITSWRKDHTRDRAWATAHANARWEVCTWAEKGGSSSYHSADLSEALIVSVRLIARLGGETRVQGDVKVARVSTSGEGWNEKLAAAQSDAAERAFELNAMVPAVPR